MRPRSGLHISLLCLTIANMLPTVQAEGSWGVLSIAIAAAASSCLAYRPDGRPRLPRWVIYVSVAASIVYLLWEMFAPHEEQTVYILDLAHFMIFLCCCKLFELRRNRDMGVVLLVSFLLLVISAFVSASLLFGLVLMLDITVGLAWLRVFQETCETDAILRRRQSDGPEFGAIGSNGAAVPFGRASPSTMVTYSAVLTVIAIAVFVTVPRGWGSGLFGGMRRLMRTSLTGMNDEVRLQSTPIIEDQSLVLRARFIRRKELITDEDFHPYLRGLTFDRYHDGRWQRTPAVSEVVFPAGTPQDPMPLSGANGPQGLEDVTEQQIWLDDTADGSLFAIYPPLAFGSIDVDRVYQDRKDLALHVRASSRSSIHYVVRSMPDAQPSVQRSLEFKPTVSRDGPSDIPLRVADFARELASRYGDPSDPAQHRIIARRFCDYLHSAVFAYTLNRGHVAAEFEPVDPVQNFLFVNRRGHCEYFATAMTVLCQAVGIRARLVGGYHGGEFNGVGEFYQFRRKDAHAWVEVYLPEEGWVTFDPSPIETGRRSTQDTSLGARLRQMLDFVQFKWSLFVVSFDKESRQELAGRFLGWLRTLGSEERGPKSFWGTLQALAWGPDVLPIWQRLLYWLLLALSTTLALLLLRVLWILSLMVRERLPRQNRRGAGPVRRAEAKFYDRVLLLLANKGHIKPAQQTPREFAEELARRYPDLALLPEITHWFYESQYGHRVLSADRHQRLGPFLQRLREDSAFGAA
jgi:hypothetical protein